MGTAVRTAVAPHYNLVFVIEAESVYSAVRTESLYQDQDGTAFHPDPARKLSAKPV